MSESPELTVEERGERHQMHRAYKDLGPYCVWCLNAWPCDAAIFYQALRALVKITVALAQAE